MTIFGLVDKRRILRKTKKEELANHKPASKTHVQRAPGRSKSDDAYEIGPPESRAVRTKSRRSIGVSKSDDLYEMRRSLVARSDNNKKRNNVLDKYAAQRKGKTLPPSDQQQKSDDNKATIKDSLFSFLDNVYESCIDPNA